MLTRIAMWAVCDVKPGLVLSQADQQARGPQLRVQLSP